MYFKLKSPIDAKNGLTSQQVFNTGLLKWRPVTHLPYSSKPRSQILGNQLMYSLKNLLYYSQFNNIKRPSYYKWQNKKGKNFCLGV